MQSVIIGGNQAGQRLDKFLHKLLPEAGTGFLYKMLRKKNITLNGRKAEGSELLSQGDKVCFFFSDETFDKFAGKSRMAEKFETTLRIGTAVKTEMSMKYETTNFHITSLLKEYSRAYQELMGVKVIYEDEHVLILDKPAGMLTQKASGGDISLNEWMIGYLLERDPGFAAELDTFRPSVCNRLDRNTSGLVLCGKSLAGLQFLSHCIRERSIRKFYRTICVGKLKEPALVKGYLSKDRNRNRVSINTTLTESSRPNATLTEIQRTGDDRPVVVNKDKPLAVSSVSASDGEEYIETAYRPICVGDKYTLLEVELITGKPHQIRAHLAGLGHPLIGDFKYGNTKVNRNLQQTYGLEHQLLHAFRLEFPETEEPAGLKLSGRVITAPCPKQFEQIQKALELS